MLRYVAPLNFDFPDKENYLVVGERDFMRLCAILRKEGVGEPENLPALDFWMNIDILKKKNTKSKKTHEEN